MGRNGNHIPERFLRQIWKHRQFNSPQLQTTEGKPLEVIFPGELNRDGGPDFTGAKVRIGTTLYVGDVEIHSTDDEWLRHSHNADPKYNTVILHVVFSSNSSTDPPRSKSKRAIPVLELRSFLSSPDSACWNEMILMERDERFSAIRCLAENAPVDGELIRLWIEKLAMERIELKIRGFEDRMRELVHEHRLIIRETTARYEKIRFGLNPDELPIPFPALVQRDFSDLEAWRQLLYEGVMEALGYVKNAKPFLRLARNLSLAQFRRILEGGKHDRSSIEALLFGAAGLIPKMGDMHDKESRFYVRRLRERWKSLKLRYHKELIHSTEWQFFRLRPENFPTIRLAGAATLIPRLLEPDFLPSIVTILKNNSTSTGEKQRQLEAIFNVAAGEFWENHYRFGDNASSRLKTLVGRGRSDEIIINIVVPILLLYGRIFKDTSISEATMGLLHNSGAASDNAIQRQISEQLIREKFKVDSALLQQGVLRLHKEFCSPGHCSECAVGKIVFPGENHKSQSKA